MSRAFKSMREFFIFVKNSEFEEFEYPDYGGLPEDVIDTMPPHFVDAIQEEYPNRKSKTDDEWVTAVKTRLNRLGFRFTSKFIIE